MFLAQNRVKVRQDQLLLLPARFVWNQSWHIAIWFNLLMQLLFHPWECPEVAIKNKFKYSVYFFCLCWMVNYASKLDYCKKGFVPQFCSCCCWSTLRPFSSSSDVVSSVHRCKRQIYAYCFWEALFLVFRFSMSKRLFVIIVLVSCLINGVGRKIQFICSNEIHYPM